MSAETNTARSPESSSNTKALEWVKIGNVLVVAFDNLKKVLISKCVAALGFVILEHEGTGTGVCVLLVAFDHFISRIYFVFRFCYLPII